MFIWSQSPCDTGMLREVTQIQFRRIETPAARELRDFGDTAGLIANLDLVVSVDTSVAHLAGALGKPVWVLLPFAPDWRWMMDRDDSPWYGKARLFRQEKMGNWRPVLQRVAREVILEA